MRRNIEIQHVTKSTKVNWNMVEELKLNKPIIRKKRVNYNNEILENINFYVLNT
jgi:hypothetical protein